MAGVSKFLLADNDFSLTAERQRRARAKGRREGSDEAAKNQPSLTNGSLAAVMQLVNDDNWLARFAAVEILGKQPSLSDKSLAAVAWLLESGNDGDLVERQLRKHKAISSKLLSGPVVGPLFNILSRRAFVEQYGWCIEHGRSTVNTRDGVRSACIDNLGDSWI